MIDKKTSYKDQRLTKAQQKKTKPINSAGIKNYFNKSKTVTVPKKWLSSPDHVVAELAYITPREQKILLDADLYGSLKGKPNRGPGGIMSLQGGGSGWGGGNQDNSENQGGGYSCFIAGTKVTMADGTFKNIEEIIVGDKIKGHKNDNEVIKLDPTLLANRKLYSFNNNEHYFFTSEHPFMTEEGWKSVKPEKTKERDGIELYNQLEGELKIGDKLVTDKGLIEITDIKSKEINKPDMPLYNFNVSNDNSYIADGYVVHNKGGSSTPDNNPAPDNNPTPDNDYNGPDYGFVVSEPPAPPPQDKDNEPPTFNIHTDPKYTPPTTNIYDEVALTGFGKVKGVDYSAVGPDSQFAKNTLLNQQLLNTPYSFKSKIPSLNFLGNTIGKFGYDTNTKFFSDNSIGGKINPKTGEPFGYGIDGYKAYMEQRSLGNVNAYGRELTEGELRLRDGDGGGGDGIMDVYNDTDDSDDGDSDGDGDVDQDDFIFRYFDKTGETLQAGAGGVQDLMKRIRERINNIFS